MTITFYRIMKTQYNFSPTMSDQTVKKIGLAVVVAVVLVVLVSSTVTAVGTGKVGVVTQFGQVTGREMNEGLQLKAPWQQVTIYDVRVQKDEARAQAATNDLQDVSSALAVNYHLDRGRISDIHRNLGPSYKDRI